MANLRVYYDKQMLHLSSLNKDCSWHILDPHFKVQIPKKRRTFMVYSSIQRSTEPTHPHNQPGGAIDQPESHHQNIEQTPPNIRQHQIDGNASGYKSQARKDGIPFRPHGLFPPGDKHLNKLATTPDCWPFEKHLPGHHSPYELLPDGGWVTGDSAAQRGVDLRLFYQEPSRIEGDKYGTVLGALRFGEGASIGSGFFLSAHGGAIETVLDESTAELGKIEFFPFLSTVEASFKIRRPCPLHTTLAVKCIVKEQKGIRGWIDGQIMSIDGHDVYATCSAQLVDMKHFIKP